MKNKKWITDTIPTTILCALTATAILACGGNGDRTTNGNNTASSQANNSVDYYAPEVTVLNSQYVEINILNVNVGNFQWRQTAGQAATIISGENSASLYLLTPSNVVNGEKLTFQIEHENAGTITTGAIDIIVNACDAGPDDMFIDCVAPSFGALRSYEAENDHPDGFVDGVYFNGYGDRHINWEMVDTGEPEHNTVIQIYYGANDPLNEINTNGWFGIGAPDDLGPPSAIRTDLSAYKDGSISFDVRQMDGEDGIIGLGLECGWPCTSEHKLITTTFEWQTVTIALADFIESGVDLTQLDVAFMFREPWWNQDAHTYQIDNIRLSKSYTRPIIDEPSRPASAPTIDLLAQGDNLKVGTGMGIALTDPTGDLQADYDATGGYSWLYSEFIEKDELSDNSYLQFRDLSDYFHADLVINYTVNSWGFDTEGVFIVDAYCGPSCNLFPTIALPRTEEGAPSEFRIPVKEMVARGLQLDNVARIFQMKLRNSQPNGISITLHNVHLELP